MNTGLAAVIVGVAIVGILAGIVIPVVRSRGRQVGWETAERVSAPAVNATMPPESVGGSLPPAGPGRSDSPPA